MTKKLQYTIHLADKYNDKLSVNEIYDNLSVFLAYIIIVG